MVETMGEVMEVATVEVMGAVMEEVTAPPSKRK
jgi:hypothetical protein